MMSSFDIEYNRLNGEQKNAVDTIDGPVLVLAGPGSGKTQILSLRTANILKQTDTNPQNILCLTFTEAAANNMRQRLVQIIGPEAYKITVSTFHAFGSSIIQNYPEYFDKEPLTKHAGELRQYEILSNIFEKLTHNNILSTKQGDTYFHLNTSLRTISWIRQADIPPEQLIKEVANNLLQYKQLKVKIKDAFAATPNIKALHTYIELRNEIKKLGGDEILIKILSELDDAITQTKNIGRNASPITAWRNKWLKKNRLGEWQFIDEKRYEYLESLAHIYKEFNDSLKNQGYYTYDDMILQPIIAIENNETLRLILQEKYQFILVDEYQDTNKVQNKLLYLLADSPVNEGRPNLMVVGDDDQAIYRFQGAESSIMKDFLEKWINPEVIILNKSYRSQQNLIDLASDIIKNAPDRLENITSSVKKSLIGVSDKKTEINFHVYENDADEFNSIAETINEHISKGAEPSSIAVLAPKHRTLTSLLPYLKEKNIPIKYERIEHIFEQPAIIEITDIIELTCCIARNEHRKIEQLIPKIFSARYWGLTTKEWLQIASIIAESNESWFSKLSNHKVIGHYLELIQTVAKDSISQPFLLSLFQLLGFSSIENSKKQKEFLPWKNFYFSEDKIEESPLEYLRFNKQLNKLIDSFNDWRPESISIYDFEEFIELYKKSKLPLNSEIDYGGDEAVNVMTAYASKGSEWKIVFIINCHEDIWGTKTRHENLSFQLPTKLKWVEPPSVTSEDLIRLFYVGITRTRENLYISAHRKHEGKQTELLSWLKDTKLIPTEEPEHKTSPLKLVNKQWFDYIYEENKGELKQILKPLLLNYKLSATHLLDFINLEHGGPKHFILKDLLRVRDTLNPSTMYGDSIHKTLEWSINQLSINKLIPPKKAVLGKFEEILNTQILNGRDISYLLTRGKEELNTWFDSHDNFFIPEMISEKNFYDENVRVGDARLTGKIDLIIPKTNKDMTVIDYKTSNPIPKWDSSVKSYTYQKQLMFYKLLVENSDSFKGSTVTGGMIDFIPSLEGKNISLEFLFDKDRINELIRLINSIWARIINLDFPDTSQYPSTLKGIKEFESDLLKTK